MKFRPVREFLSDAIDEMVTLESALAALARHLGVAAERITFKEQGWDERIGWYSYLVLVDGVPRGYVNTKPEDV